MKTLEQKVNDVIIGKNRLDKCPYCDFKPLTRSRNRRASTVRHICQMHKDKYKNKTQQIMQLFIDERKELLREIDELFPFQFSQYMGSYAEAIRGVPGETYMRQMTKEESQILGMVLTLIKNYGILASCEIGS